MTASIHYVNGQEAALVKLGYYDRNYDPYDGLSDSIYRSGHAMRDRSGHAMRDQQRLEMEDKDLRARAFAGRAARNPGELEALQQKLTQNEIDESRGAHGVVGGFLGGSLGALGGSALGAALRPHGPASALGTLGGAALGGYGGYRLMEPMGQEAGQANADEIIDLAHTHGLQNLPKPGAGAQPPEPAAKLAYDITPSPTQLKLIGRHTAGGALGGALGGGLIADDGHGLEGALRGGLMGGAMSGLGSGLGTVGGNALAGQFTKNIDPAVVRATRKIVERHMLDRSGPTTGMHGLLGGVFGVNEAAAINNRENPAKIAFTNRTHEGLLP